MVGATMALALGDGPWRIGLLDRGTPEAVKPRMQSCGVRQPSNARVLIPVWIDQLGRLFHYGIGRRALDTAVFTDSAQVAPVSALV